MATASGLSLIGVNLSGGEYGAATPANPGRLGTDYVLPSSAELDYYAAKGMTVIRLPFSWERMQPTLGGALNATFLQQVDQVVAYANRKGMQVDLDLHGFGRYAGSAVGSAAVPAAAFANVWSRLASHYAGQGVLFGLMNEPQPQSATAWAAIAAAAVSAIRAAGATQEILVPGALNDTASSWITSGNAAALLAAIHDPASNTAFEVHEYLDANESGTSTAVSSPAVGAQRLAAVTAWAEANGARLFLGEFASGSDPASIAALNGMLGYMNQHNGAWQGATYWAGGAWWGSYPFSIEPANGVDKPQMAVLARYEQSALAALGTPAAPLQTTTPTALPAFDPAFYLAANPDVARAGMDPATHFLLYGWHENRNPDAVFDTGYYLSRNPDVRAAGMDPLLHFLQYGRAEGRLPSLVFDPARYLAANPDVAASGMDPLVHFVSYGQAENRAAPPAGGLAPADPLVDPAFFDAQLGASLLPAGAAAAAQQAASAYAATGWTASLDPDRWFSTSWYLSHNPDVLAAGMDPLLHYELFGWKEGRAPSAAFDGTAYLRANPDVAAAGMNPLLHYVVFGQAEGRPITPL